MGTQFVWLDIDTYDTTAYTLAKVAALDKSWNFDPTRTWKKYFSCKALSKQQNVPW